MNSSRYKEAGVDLEKAKSLVEIVKSKVSKLPQRGVLGKVGHFAGFFSLERFSSYKNPVLVSSTDGVGTKILVAKISQSFKGIGIDLVAMCVNDILCSGAQPLFFLDYIAFGKFDEKVFEELIEGIVEGCKLSECALLGGETAEMPGMYAPDEFDCAGFITGIVERDKIIDGSEIAVGDVLIGLPSNGLHSNGFSLVRKVFFQENQFKPDQFFEELGKPLIEELLRPTRIYYPYLKPILSRPFKIKGIAHITGGGIYDNLERILPENCVAIIEKSAWEMPPIFKLLQNLGKISEEEMFKVFNCGIGMILVVSPEEKEEIIEILKATGIKGIILGNIEKKRKKEKKVILR